MKFDTYIKEGSNPEITKVTELVKKSGQKLVGLRKPLESIFKKKDIDFVMSPIPHFRIKSKGKTIILVNKKYADDAEDIVGEIAIGYEGKV